MARSRGRRYLPAQQAVAVAQARGETNALQALRDYRAGGGSIRTQEWYRVWRVQRQEELPEKRPGEPPTIGLRPGQPPRDWLTVVGVVWWDPGERPGRAPRPESTYTYMHDIYSDSPRRISDEEAMRRAVDAAPTDRTGASINEVARQYGWVPVYAFVSQYNAIY